MRTIKETAWLILDGDGLTHQYLEDSQTTHILEIEIDVPDERDLEMLEKITQVEGYLRNLQNQTSSFYWDQARQLLELLKPRPPRATIREVEK